MKKLLTGSIILVSLALLAHVSEAVTYYIRIDGGTAQQCNGTADAPYPGSGTNQACAWAHPFWALDSDGNWKIQGGDTLLIYSGSYQMGFGAPNTGWCSTEGTWDCHLPALPSGTSPQNPTKLLGVGWNSGCANPPELWGTQRTNYILTLNGTSNAVIDCLEITDHLGCVESHPNSSVACQRDTYPYGDWALLGIYAADSSNVTLRHLNIHGLAHTGIRAGRLTDWTVEDVRIAGNGMAGWDGDLQEGVNLNSNHGTLTFRRLTVEYSGCAESYPGKQPNNCWGQSVGGYGDGFGQGGLTGGHWIIEDSVFRYNTQDGIDMLYVRESNSQIEIKRTKSYGNAGDQMKVNGPARIENSLMVSNCSFFHGKSFTYNVGDCRAGGSALVFSMRRGSKVSVVNSTLVGQGDCLLIVQCDTEALPTCDGSEVPIIQNNIFQGHPEFGTDDMTCDVWFDLDNFYQTQEDYNVIHPDTKLGEFQHGSHDIFQDPLFVNSNLETFDGHLQAGSPAIDSGLPVGSLNGLIPSNDLTGAPRPYGSGVDRGAYEYGANPPQRDEIMGTGGTWSSGIWYYNLATKTWSKPLGYNPSGPIAVGEVTGDGKADMVSCWPSGLWYQNGDTLAWTKVWFVAPSQVAVGDITGDGRAEIIGTWGNGIWYWNPATSGWTQMYNSVPSGPIAAGDVTGDGRADVVSCWPSGLWYQNGATLGWTKVWSVAPSQVAVGDITGDGWAEIIGTWGTGIWYWNPATSGWTKMWSYVPSGPIAAGDVTGDGRADVVSVWPSGLWYQDGATLGWTNVYPTAPSKIAVGDITGN